MKLTMTGVNILVTGARGLLGGEIMKQFNQKDGINISGSQCNINNHELITSEILEKKPNFIIHAAAYTDVDGCELNPSKAYKVNALGTYNVVKNCLGKDIFLIYISSTGVYGNSKSSQPYNEFDLTAPSSIHHKSKLMGEKIIRDHMNRFLILRTGWLFGGSFTKKKNFVANRIKEAKGKKLMYSDNFQIGNPTYVDDLINQIYVLLKSNEFGIFNCVNSGNNVRRLDYVETIIRESGSKCKVLPAPKEMYKRVAKVSNNESAENFKLNVLGLNKMGNWRESIQRYLKNYNQ